jgi:hypothetical protein
MEKINIQTYYTRPSATIGLYLVFQFLPFLFFSQPISDYNQVQRLRAAYHAPEATHAQRPSYQINAADFQKGGKYYSPFYWGNYTLFEQPDSSEHYIETATHIRFYNTPAGRRLYKQVNEGVVGEFMKEDIQKMMLEEGRAIQLKNTDLGGLRVGNFDFLFDGGKIEIICNIEFVFPSGLDSIDRVYHKNRFFQAIAKYWTESGFALIQEKNGITKNIPIYFYIREATKGIHPHKKLKYRRRIALTSNRSYVNRHMNIRMSVDEITLAHEFGHVMALKDEYGYNFAKMRGWNKFISKLTYHAPWRDNRFPDDKKALMNRNGTELRTRYFSLILHTMKASFPQYQWQIYTPPHLQGK